MYFSSFAFSSLIFASGALLTNFSLFFATLGYASEVILQKDKNGIGEDAVSAVIPQAAIYMPFAELVDVAKELERLTKEKERLVKELAYPKVAKNTRLFSKISSS